METIEVTMDGYHDGKPFIINAGDFDPDKHKRVQAKARRKRKAAKTDQETLPLEEGANE